MPWKKIPKRPDNGYTAKTIIDDDAVPAGYRAVITKVISTSPVDQGYLFGSAEGYCCDGCIHWSTVAAGALHMEGRIAVGEPGASILCENRTTGDLSLYYEWELESA